MGPLRFDPATLSRPETGPLDCATTLVDVAIVTWAVDPDRVRHLVPARFEFDCASIRGKRQALVSFVPYEYRALRPATLGFPRLSFAQTNYRVYVIDGQTGQRCVWFLGATVDRWSVPLFRGLFKLPWSRGHTRLDCEYQDSSRGYVRYALETRSRGHSATLRLEGPLHAYRLEGFPDRETGLVVLTHSMQGFYHRLDGSLDGYRIWHPPMEPHAARCTSARIDFFDAVGVVPLSEQSRPHSVLLQRELEFYIYRPWLKGRARLRDEDVRATAQGTPRAPDVVRHR